MFDFVHENKRLVQIVLAIIILPFAFWGIDSYRRSSGTDSLATVNGEKISVQEFEDALRQQQSRLREMLGGNVAPGFFEQPEIKRSVLDTLVTQRLLVQEANRLGLGVPDEEVRELISSVEAFQTDGKFDKKKYESILAQKNLVPVAFQERVRGELSVRQLSDAFTQNGYASDGVSDALIRLNEQQREVSLVKLDLAAFLKKTTVSDTEVDEYYQRNASEFKLPERVKVEYLTLSAQDLLAQAEVSDSEIRDYYEAHRSEFGEQEQRQAAHILIATTPKATLAEKQAAKDKAENVLQQVKAAPGKFAELAKQYSQDPGSAANGGDLGLFGKGAMVKPFEEAVFSMKQGEVSGLVESDFGFHIIKVLAIKAGKTQSLPEVRNLISQRLKAQKSLDHFAELADKFSNTVYEQSDNLKPAASLIHGEIKQSGWIEKGKSTGAPWTDKVMQAIFSDEAIKNKRNTSAIEVAPNVLLAAHVTEYKPADTQPLAEVVGAIRQKLQHQKAVGLAAQEGDALLKKLQQGEKVNVAWQAARTYSRSKHEGLSNELMQKVFEASGKNLPAYAGGMEDSQGYVLARVDAIKDNAVIDANKHNRYVQQIRQIAGDELMRAYLVEARKHADIKSKQFTADNNK